MITAAYTICKNEIKYVEKWLYYSDKFTYRVLLDTGSTDGTWEALQEAASKDKNLIVEKKVIEPWHFSNARNYNLEMIPMDVEWCLSPDLDEYFSINVLQQMKITMDKNPNVTNIACDRLDIYSDVVRVGPPKLLSTNKIHRRHDYKWVQPIYEHLWFKHHDTRKEIEIYNEDIYLIHDQDFKKKSRPELYIKMLKDEYNTNPSNCWTMWYLLDHYYKERDLNNYVDCGIVFCKHSQKDTRLEQVKGILKDIYINVSEIDNDRKAQILKIMAER